LVDSVIDYDHDALQIFILGQLFMEKN